MGLSRDLQGHQFQALVSLGKTREELYAKVETAIKKLRSYETPEIIAVPIIKGSKEYLNWLDRARA